MSNQIYPFRLYNKRLSILVPAVLSLLVNFLSWFWLFWQIPREDQQLFLHYNVLFGVDKVGSYAGVFVITIIGLALLIINYLLGWLMFNHDSYSSIILNYMSLICQIFVFVGTLLIVFMNV